MLILPTPVRWFLEAVVVLALLGLLAAILWEAWRPVAQVRHEADPEPVPARPRAQDRTRRPGDEDGTVLPR